MRKIKIETWKSRVPVMGEDGKPTGEFNMMDETLLTALNVLIGNKKPEDMPRGLDKFRIFNRLSKAFDKADKTKMLELEEVDYKFLKETIEKDIPSAWGMNQNVSKAIESFLEADGTGSEEVKKED